MKSFYWVPSLLLVIAMVGRRNPLAADGTYWNPLYVFPGLGLPKILEGFQKPTAADILELDNEVENKVAFQEIGVLK